MRGPLSNDTIFGKFPYIDNIVDGAIPGGYPHPFGSFRSKGCGCPSIKNK